MRKVSLLNCANGASQSIIRALTKKGVEVKVGDLFPNFAAQQNFLYFLDTLSPEQQSLVKTPEHIDTKSDINNLLKGSDHIILTAHNYLRNTASKEKVLESCFESMQRMSSEQKCVVVTPLEHLHYSQDQPVQNMEKVVRRARGYHPSLISVQAELIFGQDVSTLHTFVNMLVNHKFKHQLFGQKYISPVDSEDFSQGVVQILENEKVELEYILRGQSTHMIKELIEISEQKVEQSLVSKQNWLECKWYSPEEHNMQLMLQHFVCTDHAKAMLKDLNIQAKEFNSTFQYKPQVLDTHHKSIGWHLYSN